MNLDDRMRHTLQSERRAVDERLARGVASPDAAKSRPVRPSARRLAMALTAVAVVAVAAAAFSHSEIAATAHVFDADATRDTVVANSDSDPGRAEVEAAESVEAEKMEEHETASVGASTPAANDGDDQHDGNGQHDGVGQSVLPERGQRNDVSAAVPVDATHGNGGFGEPAEPEKLTDARTIKIVPTFDALGRSEADPSIDAVTVEFDGESFGSLDFNGEIDLPAATESVPMLLTAQAQARGCAWVGDVVVDRAQVLVDVTLSLICD